MPRFSVVTCIVIACIDSTVRFYDAKEENFGKHSRKWKNAGNQHFLLSNSVIYSIKARNHHFSNA